MTTPTSFTVIACALLATATFGRAATISGEIENVDAKAGTLTISAGTRMTTLRFRASVVVNLNGQPATVAQLSAGMTAVVNSNEPGLANIINASGGTPATASKHERKPAGQESVFTSLDSIAALVPATVDLKTSKKVNVVAVDQANEAIEGSAKGRPARLRFKVEVFEPFKADGWAFRIMATDSRVTVGGSLIHCRVWAYFKADQAGALERVSRGKSVTVEGIMGRADVRLYDGSPGLSIDLVNAALVQQP
jgi:hypothetical protein